MKKTMIELLGRAFAAKAAAQAAKAAAEEFTLAVLNTGGLDGAPVRKGVRLGGLYPRGNLTQFSNSPAVHFQDDFTRAVVAVVDHVVQRDGVWLLFDASQPAGPVRVHVVYESLRISSSPEVTALMARASLDTPGAPIAAPSAPAAPVNPRSLPPAFLQGNGDTDDDD